MPKAKSKTITKAVKAASPDTALISLCATYSRAAAAVKATYEADPDPNNKHAERDVGRFEKEAAKALATISATKAATPLGLRAKALILDAVIAADDDGFAHFCISRGSATFFQSFAADVADVTGDKLTAEWRGMLALKGAENVK